MEKQKVSINGERLRYTLEEFADFGRTKDNGVTRLALSEMDIKARDYFLICCEELGMTVSYDDMGNMYATLPANDDTKEPVVIGSHLDSVEKGGRFDGVLGVLTGLEVVRTLVDYNIKPKVPITIANLTNEEGARFDPSLMGSGVLSGRYNKAKMLQSTDKEGVTFKDALEASGYLGEKENRLKKARAFLELHIEQGPVLDNESLEIGVVEGILGMVCCQIEVTGDSDHAGTTPMSTRKDSLMAAINLITEAQEKLSRLDKDLVYTIGRLNVEPNIHNVIPEKVIFTMEARHQDMMTLKQVEEIIHQLPESSGKEKCTVKATRLWGSETLWFNQGLVDQLEQSTQSLKYKYKRMVSGARHDALFISEYVPSAMVFVPSVHGKSHAEDELTKWEDCEKGANVILGTVLSLTTS
ncbi:Zn-dependent hydrolase [Lentibacillus sp. CBA3610]|uniref:Zn-dependent hydrolase n=1 Tax=Lentibacillus sp. CBA3610 TaxID=2518176 RepID=UPI0015951AEC|nr:Zn-dependent hydrolase [Lentibacillus sp. CBA3610]QKY70124.1 Zn-dependent hydrolase [Lentibacillus sp. CBA3610]